MKYAGSQTGLRKGATLVAVFWIMAVMGLALVATMRVARYQTNVAGNQINGIEALRYAEMGIALAGNAQMQEGDATLRRDLGDDTGFEAKIVSAGGRFNINYILFSGDELLMRQILDQWGLDVDESSRIVDALIDWTDDNDLSQSEGAERDYYEGQGFNNRPFNRPFYDLEEMRLVRGMEQVEAANPRWKDWFTVWSEGGLDITAASAEMLAVGSDGNVESARSVIETMSGPDGIRNTQDDQQIGVSEFLNEMGVPEGEQRGPIERRFTAEGRTERIESVGWAGQVRRKIVLMIRNRTGRPQILDRTEEIVQ